MFPLIEVSRSALDRRGDRPHARVAEGDPVEHDIGVEYQQRSANSRFSQDGRLRLDGAGGTSCADSRS